MWAHGISGENQFKKARKSLGESKPVIVVIESQIGCVGGDLKTHQSQPPAMGWLPLSISGCTPGLKHLQGPTAFWAACANASPLSKKYLPHI